MADLTQFKVGGVPLSPKRVNTEFLRGMYKAAKGAETAEGKESALKAIEELGKTGEISKESFEAIDSFRKGVNTEWRSDKDRYWAAWRENGKDFKHPDVKAIQQEMGVSGQFLQHDLIFQTELREATGRSAVQALAGGSFGPAGLVAAYATYANERVWNSKADKTTTELLTTYKELESGTSPMSTTGNKVKQVHREELWRAIDSLTAEAVAAGKAGKPLPITAQYYELTDPGVKGKMADAAVAGSKLRLNLDPGRLSYPSKDRATGQDYFDTDDIPDKMRTILQFTSLKGADVGVSIFPVKQELLDPTDLMHRKILRVGDKVLMSGMNANKGSGENLDAGYIVEGPAAAKFTENVNRDIQISSGAGNEEIWGAEHVEKFSQADLRMGRRGITALLDVLGGPTGAGEDLPETSNLKDLEKLAAKAGVDLKTVFEVPEGQYEKVVGGIAAGTGKASLSVEGKKQFLAVINKAVDSTKTKKNQEALADLSLPSDKAVGKTAIDVADKPSEREVLAINAISQAEKFVYLPGFVVTRPIAAAIVAKRDEMVAAGKEFDVRVIADSGIYPDGGTPNSWGVNFLEDSGVPTKWSKLTRTNHHDRKIHAKQLLTDKGEIAGSTNFSTKGMRENHETSGYVHFEAGDKEAIAQRDASKAQFEKLWDEDCYDLSARDLASYDNRFGPKLGREWAVEQDTNYAIKKIIQRIESYEAETGTLVEGFMSNPQYKSEYDAFLSKGYSEGDAALLAADKHFGAKEFRKMRDDLPTNQELIKLESTVNTWKAKYGDKE